MKHTKIIALANQKGGVGKTSLGLHLGFLLAEDSYSHKSQRLPRTSYKVTYLDFDPQCNLTYSLLLRDTALKANFAPSQTTAAFFGYTEDGFDLNLALPDAVAVPPIYDAFYAGRLECIPGHGTALADCETLSSDQVVGVAERVRQYANNCDSDFLIIDCGPQLGMRQIVAMLAADHVVAPVNADVFSDVGLSELLETYIAVQESNPGVSFLIVPNQIDQKGKDKEMIAEMRESVGAEYVTNGIQQTYAMKKAINTGRPVWRKPPSGNDSMIGRVVRSECSDVLARCGIEAK